MTTNTQMMGYEIPGDEKVLVTVRDWQALKLALWRSRVLWETAREEAARILEQCVHADGCLGREMETEPCLPHCPHRETRMSALVILNAGRTLAPVDARQPADAPFFAPSREYYSEVLSTLASMQVELQRLHDEAKAPASKLLEERQSDENRSQA